MLLPVFGGCAPRGPAPGLHYVVGNPYQAGGVWNYPREDFSLNETGLAAVYGSHGPYTADGEAFDQMALAAAHPTLQLPALARLTNLENGRQVLVRINDRGPAKRGRMIEITRRTAQLLAATDPGAIRVRVQVLENESRRMAADLRPEGPQLNVATAPPGAVRTESLAPPTGVGQSARRQTGPAGPAPRVVAADAAVPAVPLRLPEAVTQVYVVPGQLLIDCGGFSRPEYADVLRERLAALGARATTSYDAPRDRAFMVRIGPLPSVAAADAMLERALRAGATDARIVVE
nr:SPOR domain-containing protein [Limobrevibacterium gyesilva]